MKPIFFSVASLRTANDYVYRLVDGVVGVSLLLSGWHKHRPFSFFTLVYKDSQDTSSCLFYTKFI